MADIKEFEKKIAHLTQAEILAISVNALNQLLVEKGLLSKEELQNKFSSILNE